MSLYAVTATVVRDRDGWTATRQLPTFYLDSDTQGIVSEQHAQTIARELFDWQNAATVLVNVQRVWADDEVLS